MKDWLKQNGWALAIVAAGLIVNYTQTGANIVTLQSDVSDLKQQTASLTSRDVNNQLAIVQINTKLDYITLQLNKLVK